MGQTSIVEVDEMLKDLIPDFMTRRQDELKQMEKWLSEADFTSFSHYGHKLKGSSLNYGFEHLGKLAAQLEIAAKEKNFDTLKKTVAEIHDHLKEVQVVYVS